MDIAQGEMVEKELDAMIERRSRQKDPDEEHDLWRASERRHQEQRRIQARYEWHLYHTSQAERHRRTLEELIASHEAAAAKLMEASEATEGDAA